MKYHSTEKKKKKKVFHNKVLFFNLLVAPNSDA